MNNEDQVYNFTYNTQGQLISKEWYRLPSTDPDETTTYEYDDNNGNLTTLSVFSSTEPDPINITTFSYDIAGIKTQESHYFYTSVTEPPEEVISFEYNDRGDVITRTTSDGSPYFSESNYIHTYTELGRTSIVSHFPKVSPESYNDDLHSYLFDTLGNTTSLSIDDDNNGSIDRTQTYLYDSYNNFTKSTYNASSTTYVNNYDSNNSG
ncbi:hypothetical protein ACFOND_02545 [Reinekea marina]|uniref:YD repeat-containing protein n=1 Tax=Reinekea marina TaxID=1310421 RepID=A0ABV7WQA4_9GAMM